MISSHEALALVVYSEDEKRSIAKLEATIDSQIYGGFSGTPFKTEFIEQLAPRIACAIQQKYEAGGWKVGFSFSKTDRGVTSVFSFVPTSSAPLAPLSVGAKTKRLAPVSTAKIVQNTAAGSRLLVRMATRGRPIQAIDVLTKYRDMAGVPIKLEVVIDDDDATMHTGDVIQRLVALGCVIVDGYHKSKIDAMNDGRVSDWDVLLLASDDQVPVMDGYGATVLDDMAKHWPHLDGAIYYNDGMQGADMCTLSIMGRRLYDQFGWAYNPLYRSLCCDVEYTELLRQMRRLVYVDAMPIEHVHPAWGKAKSDALYEKNQKHASEDEATLARRKETRRTGSQFSFGAPPMTLSIGILTVPERRAMLDHLLDHLYAQITRHAPREAEILIDAGDGNMGAKRQRILDRAVGKYIIFVDDDDWVSGSFVADHVRALREMPDADCASLAGVMTTAGAAPEKFVHSINVAGEQTIDGVHYRFPRHINAIRLDLARSVGYKDIDYVDDQDFALRVRPLLKREANTGAKPSYFYLFHPKNK